MILIPLVIYIYSKRHSALCQLVPVSSRLVVIPTEAKHHYGVLTLATDSWYSFSHAGARATQQIRVSLAHSHAPKGHPVNSPAKRGIFIHGILRGRSE